MPTNWYAPVFHVPTPGLGTPKISEFSVSIPCPNKFVPVLTELLLAAVGLNKLPITYPWEAALDSEIITLFVFVIGLELVIFQKQQMFLQI